MRPQEENWPLIGQKDSVNGRQRAKENLSRKYSKVWDTISVWSYHPTLWATVGSMEEDPAGVHFRKINGASENSVAAHGSFNKDNEPKHTAENTQEWLRTNTGLFWSGLLWTLIWIPSNIYGKIWNLLCGEGTHQSWHLCREGQIPVDRCRSLIGNYRNHLFAVIASKGGATKY